MSNIVLEKNVPLLAAYPIILNKKIAKVCRKINFDDTGITWIIYNPTRQFSTNILLDLISRKATNDYGYCIPEINKIWISTKAIHADPYSLSLQINNDIQSFMKPNKDLLADVILDEITHIQTRCNHRNPEYEKKYKENYDMYYFNSIECLIKSSLYSNIV